MAKIPELRVRTWSEKQVRPREQFVLYWMTASRRGEYNFGLERAVHWARELRKPLIILEALRCDYPWASDRLHRFVIEGMRDNAEFFSRKPVLYWPYVEPRPGAGKGLLRTLARQACVVVSDDFPCFFLPRMQRAADRFIPSRFELVDSNALLPLRATEKVFSRAFDLRRYLQNHLLTHFAESPVPDPIGRKDLPRLRELDPNLRKKWPEADIAALLSNTSGLRDFPFDHAVAPVSVQGGAIAAQRRLGEFIKKDLPRYDDDRNQPQKAATSRLSPYLHFGHLSVHQIFAEVMAEASWTPDQVARKASGSAQGWWGVDESVEAFLDQLITWRELGFNYCSKREDYDQYESLPAWAQTTLAEHAGDAREHVYSLEQFEHALTHDPLWNASQNQLRQEGTIHNYLRMLWGKKILEWSASPREALQVMIELNNKYALDGRDPNSYSGIFWVLGRYDRAWGPERKIYGKIRYMSSKNTARKVRVKEYIAEYSTNDK